MHDESSDEIEREIDLVDIDETTSAIAVADVDEPTEIADEPAAEWTGARCEKCTAPIKSDVVTVCRKCGWYASLGMFVEVDARWEAGDETKPTTEAEPKSHLRVWLELLPRWAWVMIATVAVVLVESVVVRLATPAGSSIRMVWSLGQLIAGVLVFAGCHIFNFLVLAADDADVGLMDIILKPVKLWMRSFHYLPTRLWVSNSAVSGIAAAVFSVLIIDGIPYERFWDWGIEAPPKQGLMGAVMDRVKELESRNGADNLEDAIGDFAGAAGLEEEKAPPPKPRRKADCVILGYEVDRDGRLSELVLGTNYVGKLVFAGKVKPEMSEGERTDLLKMLAQIRTHQPIIAVQSDAARWVKPVYACRVSFGERNRGEPLRDIQWERLLGRITTQ